MVCVINGNAEINNRKYEKKKNIDLIGAEIAAETVRSEIQAQRRSQQHCGIEYIAHSSEFLGFSDQNCYAEKKRSKQNYGNPCNINPCNINRLNDSAF